MRSIIILGLFTSCAYPQNQPPVNASEISHLRFILLSSASLDHSPSAVRAFEDSLSMRFALNSQESAAIHSAGQTLKQTLAHSGSL